MSRSSHRRTVKNSIPRRPRFAPRLETLESRIAPACTYYPASQALVGTGNDIALFYYVPASGGVDIYCNGQYAGTNLGGTTTYYAGPNSKIEIDATLDSNGSDNWLWDYWAYFGHWINFDQSNITDVAFILGSGSNVVNITGPSYYLTGNLPTATVVGWGPTSVIVEDSAATLGEVFYVTPNKIKLYFDTLANLYSVGYVELRTGSGNDQFFVGNPGNSLGTMPLTYVKGGTGTDSLTLEAFDTTGERYYFTENGLHMPNWSKDVLYYQSIENTILNASSGNDESHIFSNSLTLNGVPPIAVNGGAGTDSVTYYDTNASHGNAYTMTSTSLIAWGNSTFGYSAVEALTLHAASGSNTITINSTLSGASATINAGGGHDTISVAAISGLYSDIGGPLTIDGGPGTDNLNVYDHVSPEGFGAGYAVSSTAVSITGLPTTTYNALEALTLHVGDRFTNVNIYSTLAGGPTIINGLSRYHIYKVCPTTGTLDSLGGPLTINGGPYNNHVWVYDNLSTSNGTYTINSTFLTRTGAHSVTFGDLNLGALEIYAASGNNLLNLDGISTLTSVYAGGGGDTLVVGGTIGSISSFYSVNFHGEAGTDQVIFNDVNSVADNGYIVHPDFLDLPNGGNFFHFTTEAIAILDGSGNSNITIKPWPNDSLGTMPSTTVNGGAGTDTVTLESFDTTGEKYHFTELGVHMANWGKDILFYPGIENVTLKAGTGNDEITVGSNSNKLENLPIITGNGGGGNDTMILNDSGSANYKTFVLSEVGLELNSVGNYIVFYIAIENVTLETGDGTQAVIISGPIGYLHGLPELTFDNGGGQFGDTLQFSNGLSTNDERYVLTENQLLMPGTLNLIATFTNVLQLLLFSGVGYDVFDIAPTTGTLASMPEQIWILGDFLGDSKNDTLNVFDHKTVSPQTYIVKSNFANKGWLDVPTANSSLYEFTDVKTVNLYLNGKKNWTLDTSGYDPAHYDLNIYYRVPTAATGTPAGNPDPVNPPPLPAPPAPPIGETQVSTTSAQPSPAPDVLSPRRIRADESGELSSDDSLAVLRTAAAGIEPDLIAL